MDVNYVVQKQDLDGILEFLNKFRPVWSTIPRLSESIDTLSGLKNELDLTLDEEIIEDLSSITELHTIKRDLADEVAMLSRIVLCYGRNSSQPVSDELLVSSTDIYGLDHDLFCEQIDVLLLSVREYRSVLYANYGIDQSMVDEIEATGEKYLELFERCKDMENGDESEINEKLRSYLQKANELLDHQIDPFMMLFKEETPHFYNGYHVVRRDDRS